MLALFQVFTSVGTSSVPFLFQIVDLQIAELKLPNNTSASNKFWHHMKALSSKDIYSSHIVLNRRVVTYLLSE